jgi:hypothetical protein
MPHHSGPLSSKRLAIHGMRSFPRTRHVDTLAMHLIGRMHGLGWYARSTDLIQLDRPVYADWIASGRPRVR